MILFTNKSKLINGCIANDRSAQERLFKLYYKEMLRLCIRYSQSQELAQEALNSGFLKVFQHIKSFEESKGELKVWIRIIMIRTCIDLVRKELRNIADVGSDGFDEEKSYNYFVMPDVLDKLYAEDIINATRQLPAATRVVFNLSVVDGYTHREIGEKLNITESTSRWHLTEAKKQLRSLLGTKAKDTFTPTENNNAKR